MPAYIINKKDHTHGPNLSLINNAPILMIQYLNAAPVTICVSSLSLTVTRYLIIKKKTVIIRTKTDGGTRICDISDQF